MSGIFSPLQVRAVRFSNRIVISPMCQYSAHDGFASDWHTVHVGKLAQGGASTVMLEATAVEKRGRITHGDLGIWDDAHVPALQRLATLIGTQGSIPAIQLGHAGRKASAQRPWEGNGPLCDVDATRGDLPWAAVGASAVSIDAGWPAPRELDTEELGAVLDSFRQAARRAASAGFRLVELHMAHGYLLHSFLSPLSNHRTDRYGGSLENRMRFPLEVVEAMRETLGPEIAFSGRISAVDGLEGGWRLEDSVELAAALKRLGVDLVDCSSGGIAGPATAASSRLSVKRGPGFQVPFAETIRREAGIATIAVGLITEPAQADEIIVRGQADLVAIGRQALYEPNWALHAAASLGQDASFEHWPRQYGWWLARRSGLPKAVTPRHEVTV